MFLAKGSQQGSDATGILFTYHSIGAWIDCKGMCGAWTTCSLELSYVSFRLHQDCDILKY